MLSQDADRLPRLRGVRHDRMAATPFTFYRGAAKLMAADLADTPVSGLNVQACGDAHLLNLGLYASPERAQVFDLNDFDETAEAPWEWDVKRLAASFTVAARGNGHDSTECSEATSGVVHGYRRAMSAFAKMTTLEVWHSHMDPVTLLDETPRPDVRHLIEHTLAKARRHDNLQALAKLTVMIDGKHRIVSNPPLLVPLRDLSELLDPSEVDNLVRESFDSYLESLQDDRKVLLRRFRIVDAALKVVGVGSVGTRCFIVLLEGRDSEDPLFLQIKEASRSVLEDHTEASPYPNHGQRVVEGQRLMQTSSDIFLGWIRGPQGRDYYWRQLRDMKGAAPVESMSAPQMSAYARICGWALARAHARSGDPVAISAYLGSSDVFDRAVTEFSATYADQNEEDHRAFVAAARSARPGEGGGGTARGALESTG
ncbi:MAG: hypothetical protein JJLCMIEE_01718 [Acidimicrobiales bacterium]|nr:hypothetical protein [Acidimicrobiales bacterium]